MRGKEGGREEGGMRGKEGEGEGRMEGGRREMNQELAVYMQYTENTDMTVDMMPYAV